MKSLNGKELSSQVEIPRTLHIEITSKIYSAIKDRELRKLTPLARTHIENYFEFIKALHPDDVIDSIEYGESLKQKYDKASMGIRINVAMARAVLKVSPQLQKRFKEVLSSQLVKYTLKFENPSVYEIIMRYGERGEKYLQGCLSDSLEIFGVK